MFPFIGLNIRDFNCQEQSDLKDHAV